MTEDEIREAEWAYFDRKRADGHSIDWLPPYADVNAEEWLTSTDPSRMLEALVGKNRDRKFRLFACACCRDIWDLLTHDPDRRAVEVAESFADGVAMLEELAVAHEGCSSAESAGSFASNDCRHYDMHFAACRCSWAACRTAGKRPGNRLGSQAGFLRDIFGNPFRSAAFDPAWRTTNVTALGSVIYANRAFDRLPILADALEDAGCDDRDILDHCRQPGEHVRGCWAVDLVLGKV